MLSVQFIVGAAFSIVPPLIPLVLPGLGVHGPGAVRTWAGTLVGVTPLAAALMSPQWGRWVDRFDARLIILVSCLVAAVCTASMGFARNPWQLLTLRFTMGLFGGHVAAALAIMSSAAPPDKLGWALGCLTTGQLSGTLFGPLIGGLIADALASLHAPFLLAGASVLLVTGFVLLVPAGAKIEMEGHGNPEPKQSRRPLPATVRHLIVTSLLVQCAIMVTQPIISLHVRALVGDRVHSTTLAGLGFSVVGLGGLIAAPLLGTLSDRAGAGRLLLCISLAAAACVVPQAYATTYSWFVAERFVAGLFLGSAIPIVNSLVARATPADKRGHAFGVASGAAFLGAFLGPVSGGLLGARLGLTAVFQASAGLLVLTSTWVAITIWPAVTPTRRRSATAVGR